MQPDLDAAGRCAVDEDPLFVGAVRWQRPVADCAFVAVVLRLGIGRGREGRLRSRRTVVGWYDGLADDVSFANPGTLGVGKHDGDDMTAGLEGMNEGKDVGGGFGAWWAIVVDYEDMHFGRLQSELWENEAGKRQFKEERLRPVLRTEEGMCDERQVGQICCESKTKMCNYDIEVTSCMPHRNFRLGRALPWPRTGIASPKSGSSGASGTVDLPKSTRAHDWRAIFRDPPRRNTSLDQIVQLDSADDM